MLFFLSSCSLFQLVVELKYTKFESWSFNLLTIFIIWYLYLSYTHRHKYLENLENQLIDEWSWLLVIVMDTFCFLVRKNKLCPRSTSKKSSWSLPYLFCYFLPHSLTIVLFKLRCRLGLNLIVFPLAFGPNSCAFKKRSQTTRKWLLFAIWRHCTG